MPDGDERLHLVDLNPIDIQEPEPSFVEADVFFVLFTRRNPTSGQRITSTAASINNSQWSSASSGTRFIIHGWNNNHQSSVNVEITRAFLAHSDHNVIGKCRTEYVEDEV